MMLRKRPVHLKQQIWTETCKYRLSGHFGQLLHCVSKGTINEINASTQQATYILKHWRCDIQQVSHLV